MFFKKKVLKEVWIVYSEWPLLRVNQHETFSNMEAAREAAAYCRARDPKRDWWYSMSEVHEKFNPEDKAFAEMVDATEEMNGYEDLD